MPIFTKLYHRALFLPHKVSRFYAKQYTLGGFFGCCLPPLILEGVMIDAQLIQQIAKCLDFYPVDEDKKLAVLIGSYLYIWGRHEGIVQGLVDKPFLCLLGSHLEVSSMDEMDKAMYKSSLVAFDDFCKWTFQYQSLRHELNELYHLFPPDILADIRAQRNHERGHESFIEIICQAF